MELKDHAVWIPKLGWVNLAENLRYKGKITGARVTKTSDWWFISIQEEYENQVFLKTALKKLRQANKRLHRRKLGSKNREKARRQLARLFSDASLGKLLSLLTSKVEQRGGQIVKVGRFFASSKTCHSCGWKWEDMTLADRVFLCQNQKCAYHHFPQDRDGNASLNILQEALHLIGLLAACRREAGASR
jgi:putative transposase